MAKPKCEIGGKCPFQKDWFYIYGEPYPDCPHDAYEPIARHKKIVKETGETVYLYDDGCKHIVSWR